MFICRRDQKIGRSTSPASHRLAAHAPLSAARLFSFDSLNSLQNHAGTHHVRYHPLASLDPRVRPPCRHRKCPSRRRQRRVRLLLGLFFTSPQTNRNRESSEKRWMPHPDFARQSARKKRKNPDLQARDEATAKKSPNASTSTVDVETDMHSSPSANLCSARRPPPSAPGAGTRRSRAPSSVSTWVPPTRVFPSSRLVPPRSSRTLRVPVPPPPSSPSPRVSFPADFRVFRWRWFSNIGTGEKPPCKVV